MKWIVYVLSLFFLSPAYGQTKEEPTPTLDNNIPTREERLERLRERQAERSKRQRETQLNRPSTLGSPPDSLTREEIKRNQEARSALRTEARRDKRLRRVRGLKKRLEGVRQDQERSLHSHQWRMARIHVALEMCEDTDNKELIAKVQKLKARSEALRERESRLLSLREKKADETFKKARQEFRATAKPTSKRRQAK